MNLCPEKEELSAFVDGEVSENRLEEIDGHLKTCEACSKTVNSFLTLQNYVAEPSETGSSLKLHNLSLNSLSTKYM